MKPLGATTLTSFMQPLDVVRDKVASGIAGRSLSHAVERFAVHPHYDPSVDQ